jgi:hypothetical protein
MKSLIAKLQSRAENIQEARAGTVFSTRYPKNTLLHSNLAISIMTICLLGPAWVLPFYSLLFPYLGALINLRLPGFHHYDNSL